MINYFEQKHKICWSSIFVGVISAIILTLIISMFLYLLGWEIGGIMESNSNNRPAFFITWTMILVIIIAMAVGGWISGHFANYSGALHGFLTWAILSIIAILSIYYFFNRVSNNGNNSPYFMMQSSLTENKEKSDIPQLIDGKFNDIINELYKDINKLLGNINLHFLQPDKLESLVNQTQQTINQAWSDIYIYPAQKKKIIDYLINNLQQSKLTLNNLQSFDQEKVIDILVKNGFNSDKAKDAVTKAADAYKTVLQFLEEKIEDTTKTIKNNGEKATFSPKYNYSLNSWGIGEDNSDSYDMNDASSLWRFIIGLIIGGLLSILFGFLGAQFNCRYCCYLNDTKRMRSINKDKNK
ncbi:TIGR04086 family membrane protein [Bartonella sp. DGB1]|uniref:TIGR04086 family membrane protein n=1 Tax=Bartonella sp. DGB1 TaxID=3239807 RepID=UPI00352479A1